MTKSVPEIHEPVRQKQKKSRAFSRIAILSSYFEQKIAALSGNGSSQKKSGWRLPGFSKKKRRYKNAVMLRFEPLVDFRLHFEESFKCMEKLCRMPPMLS
jgi:hypothetical protein